MQLDAPDGLLQEIFEKSSLEIVLKRAGIFFFFLTGTGDWMNRLHNLVSLAEHSDGRSEEL